MGHLASRYLSSDVLAKIEGANLEYGLLRIDL
jgi:hypothetical protein